MYQFGRILRDSVFAILLFMLACCQIENAKAQQGADPISFGIMFYNVENLFHPANDSLCLDDDFTPEGPYHWTFTKYRQKIGRVAKTIVAVGQGKMPAVVGLCEIENQYVLNDLVYRSILSAAGLKYIHKNSPDLRGIDVAFLYDPGQFLPIAYDFLNVSFSGNDLSFITRDILHVEGIIPTGEKAHFFVNHWPSRRGGAVDSAWKRETMANLLRSKVDQILEGDRESIIIIMGDFNDGPEDPSIREILGAGPPNEDSTMYELVNLMYPLYERGEGSHYRINNFAEANLIDQFIISDALMYGKRDVKVNEKGASIYKNPSMTIEKNGLPLRTFQGLKYIGGFSDHFPIYFNLMMYSDNEN